MKRTVLSWLVVGLISFALLPWHMTRDGAFSFDWLRNGLPSTGRTMILHAGNWWGFETRANGVRRGDVFERWERGDVPPVVYHWGELGRHQRGKSGRFGEEIRG